MPTNSGYYYGFWEADPRRWDRCMAAAEKAMLAQGWNRRAGKFDEVRRRKALQLWRTA